MTMYAPVYFRKPDGTLYQAIGPGGPPGPAGPTGPAGAQGDPGAPGVGVPAGGTTAQALTKKSGTDYDTQWTTVSGAPTGPAGGDLTGSYPNPTLAVDRVKKTGDTMSGTLVAQNNINLSGGGILWTATDKFLYVKSGDLSSASGAGVLQPFGVGPPTADTHAATKLYVDGKVAAGGPPSGPAGGDLSGSYPNPQIAAGVIVDADINSAAGIATSKISGLDTALTGKAPVTRQVIAGAGLTGGGDLSADRTLNVVGDANLSVAADVINVLSAPKWTTARTLTLTGDVTGSTSIDGSGNVSLATTGPVEVTIGPTQPDPPTDIWIDTDDPGGTTNEFVLKSGDTMTGPLRMEAESILLNGPSHGYITVTGKTVSNKSFSFMSGATGPGTNGSNRWVLASVGSSQTGGVIATDDLVLHRYDDAGGYLGYPLVVKRAGGEVYIPKQYVYEVPVTVAGGWTGTITAYRAGNVVTVTVSALRKATAQGSLEIIGTVPVGLRPTIENYPTIVTWNAMSGGNSRLYIGTNGTLTGAETGFIPTAGFYHYGSATYITKDAHP